MRTSTLHQQDQVITARSPATALLVVDSADRNPTKVYASNTNGDNTTFYNPLYPFVAPVPNTPYDFTIARGQNVFTGFVKRIGITEICFKWGLFQINETCNKFYYTTSVQDGPQYGVERVIPVGFYTAQQLAEVLTLAIDEGAEALQVGWDPVSQRFNMFSNDGLEFAVIPPTDNPFNGDTFQNKPYKSLFDIMGWVYSTCGEYSSTRKVAGNPPSRWTEYVDIVCTNLTNNQCIKDFSTLPELYNPKNLLCRLYLDQDIQLTTDSGFPYSGPTTYYRQFNPPKMIEWNEAQPIGNLQFQVFDDSGRILQSWAESIQPTYACPDWKMTMLLSED